MLIREYRYKIRQRGNTSLTKK